MDLFELLKHEDIHYESFDHPAVFTCEQVRELALKLPGSETKNLFLRDDKGRRHFLVSVPPECSVDLKALSAALGAKGLGFASAQRLENLLKITPGAVTLLAVVNDSDQKVEVVIDSKLWQSAALQCHPLVNTATLVIAKADLERFLMATGHSPKIMDIPRAGV